MKSFWLYLILAGLPILGITLILFIGRDLQAPASVKGTWLITGLAQSEVEDACGVTLSWQGQPQMLVSQSGPDLIIALNDSDHTTLKGYLDDLSISAQEAGSSATPGGLGLTAEVDRQAEPDHMYGTLTSNQCAGPIPF